MALNPGDPECTEGLSKRIWDQWTAAGLLDGNEQVPEPGRTTNVTKFKAMAYGVAKGVVDEINENG